MTDTISTRAPADPNKRNVMLVFIGLMVTMLLASLDQTIFSTALPTIVGELNGVDHMLWVTTAYILATTIVMPVYGKLGDLIGRKGLFIAAIALFIAGSIIGALAGDMGWLIAGRAVQGLGGGGLMILSQAIIADVVPARERGKYMGVMGGVFALSSIAGPLLGGWFTEGIGWRWAFWINLPLGGLAILAAVLFLRLPKVQNTKARLDVAGMILLAIASTCLVLVTTWGGNTYEWDSLIIISLIVGGVLAAVAFVFVERSAVEPIMPLHLFKERNFNLTTLAGLIIGIAMFGALAYIPTYLQMVTGVNATQAGYLMIPMLAALLVASIGSGILITKYGRYKWMPILGTLIVAVSLVLLSTMTPDMEIWVLCSYLAIMGFGLGLAMQVLVLVVQNTFPASQVGTATASNNYFREIGASLGSAIVGSLFVARLTDLLAERMPEAAGSAGTDTNSFTPTMVKELPGPIKDIVVGAYNDSLTPVFLYMTPIIILAAILLCFVKEVPLATTIVQEGLTPIDSTDAPRVDTPASAGSVDADSVSADSVGAGRSPNGAPPTR